MSQMSSCAKQKCKLPPLNFSNINDWINDKNVLDMHTSLSYCLRNIHIKIAVIDVSDIESLLLFCTFTLSFKNKQVKGMTAIKKLSICL